MPRCKHCKDKFEVKYFNQKYHLDRDECIKAMVESNNAKLKKETEQARKADTKERKEKIKTYSEFLKDLQKVFNEWVRESQRGSKCISCSNPTPSDAGHYKSVGANPELRFEPLNVHLQCRKCNGYWGGNLIEYRKGLIQKIGVEKVEWLEGPHEPTKLSVEEIKELITLYRAKIKTLKV